MEDLHLRDVIKKICSRYMQSIFNLLKQTFSVRLNMQKSRLY
ncbi:MAG: hypothetical protein JWO58_2995 [Chitinophagaceae bacterium]|nr:hypothetical protein [Chitinophagaceae bacterium]